MNTSDLCPPGATEWRRPETSLYDLARSLARPVSRGLLAHQQADATILCTALRRSRSGEIQNDPIDAARFGSHVMQLHVERLIAKREAAAGVIHRTLERLIATGVPSNRLRAAAHDANGDHDFAMSEAEVEEFALAETWQHTRRGQHGR